MEEYVSLFDAMWTLHMSASRVTALVMSKSWLLYGYRDLTGVWVQRKSIDKYVATRRAYLEKQGVGEDGMLEAIQNLEKQLEGGRA